MDRIRGVIRDYDWGHPTAIAELLGRAPSGQPEAEYWLGAHPSAPSLLVYGGVALDKLLADRPAAVAGPAVAKRFSGLPYLMKILAAARPLSIQAHPSLDQARVGFAREEAAGIDRSAPNRNYRDGNHKPELICAITPFEAKCGFREVAGSRRLLQMLATPELAELTERLGAGGSDRDIVADTVGWLLRLPVERAGTMAVSAAARAADLLAEGDVAAGVDGFATELRWTVGIADAFPGDVGVVVALLLNHVSLAPGQAIFLRAGNLHSYLSGVGVELMANSDNVLRGGLTSKHIDVDELLRVVDYRPSRAPVQTPIGPVHRFDTPVPEFSLTRLDSTEAPLDEPTFDPAGPEIVLVTAGALRLVSAEASLELEAGSAGLVRFDDGRYRAVDGAPGRTVAWRAATGTQPGV